MKNLRDFTYLLPALIFAFAITSCDLEDSAVGTFNDASDKVPDFTAIAGAENVTVKVDRNNDKSYFNVNLANIGGEASMFDGEYFGWCAHWSAPINTSGQEYDGVTLYSTRNDKNWNKLNYLLNNRSRFYSTVDGAGYKEVQAVIWTLIEFKEFDIDNNRIFSDLNREAYNTILGDVMDNGDSFRHTELTVHAVFADMSVHETNDQNTQTVIVEETAWSWAGPHTINSNSFKIYEFAKQWGWVMYYWFYDVDENGNVGDEFGPDNKLTAGMYAGCGFGGSDSENPSPYDIDNCLKVGDSHVWHDDETLYVEIKNIAPDYPMSEVQLFVRSFLPNIAAPGGFPFKTGDLQGADRFEVKFEIPLSSLADLHIPESADDVNLDGPPPLYMLTHSVVGVPQYQ